MRGNGDGRGGRSSGGRYGRGRNGGYRNKRNNRYDNRGGHRGGRYGRSRPAHKSGNLRERIAIESGYLVLIDQFMLANPQFHKQISKLVDSGPEEKDAVIRKYGGAVVEVEPGNYRILRNPYSLKIIIHKSSEEDIDPEEIAANATSEQGDIYIDTRCLAMIDRELLDDIQLLEKYQQLWFADEEKACRDLLRDNGGAVRYGFQRFGDELKVSLLPGENTVCIMPSQEEKAEEAAA